MKTHIEFIHEAIVAPLTPFGSQEVGAQVEFLGIVRELENGRKIPGLTYEAYEPMARKELDKIFAELSSSCPCEEVWFIHRLDFVPVGEPSLFIRVHSRHRQEGLQLIATLIDRLKTQVPIWKISQDA